MSAVCILAPAIVAGWPAISAAVVGAAAAMGLNVVQEAREELAVTRADRVTTVEVEMEASEVLETSVSASTEIQMKQGDLTVRILRDERGQLRCCVNGVNRSRQELEAYAQQVLEKVTQVYIYNRVVSELKLRGIQLVRQEVAEDQSVHLHVRHTIE